MRYLRRPLTDYEIKHSIATAPGSMKSPTGGPTCDFCGSAEPLAFVYAADRMSTGAPIACWRWMLCRPCADGVEDDAWAFLEERSMACVRGLPQYVPEADDALRRAVQFLYDDFRTHAVPDPVTYVGLSWNRED